MRQRGFRLSLLGRFSLLSLMALTALGVVVGLVLTSRIEHRAVTNATRLAVVMARTGAASALTPSDLRGPVSPRRAAELDRTLKRPLTGNGAAIVKVYNEQGHGRLRRQPRADRRTRARRGDQAARRQRRQRDGARDARQRQGRAHALRLPAAQRRGRSPPRRRVRAVPPLRPGRRRDRARHPDPRADPDRRPAARLARPVPHRRQRIAPAAPPGPPGPPDQASQPRPAARRRRAGCCARPPARTGSSPCC